MLEKKKLENIKNNKSQLSAGLKLNGNIKNCLAKSYRAKKTNEKCGNDNLRGKGKLKKKDASERKEGRRE